MCCQITILRYHNGRVHYGRPTEEIFLEMQKQFFEINYCICNFIFLFSLEIPILTIIISRDFFL
jgi:hypothetical protein